MSAEPQEKEVRDFVLTQILAKLDALTVSQAALQAKVGGRSISEEYR
jgi:hypothetical protein